MPDPSRARWAATFCFRVFPGPDGKNGDPDNAVINVPVWSGQYAAVAAVTVLAVGGAGAILALHHAGGKPREADAHSCGLGTCSVLRGTVEPSSCTFDGSSGS
jgi:hypothetical protein